MIRGWFTIAYQPEKQPKWDEIRKSLMDRSNSNSQAEALEQLVLLSYTETIPPHLLMPVVQYTATTHDHRVIKLLLMFLENIDTRDTMGKMRPEFILITDAIRNLLLHPNEYVRGAALRFLYKMSDREILSQLLSPILTNLTHHDEYVRRHAAILVGRLARDITGFSDDLSEAIIEAFSTEADQRTLTAMLYSAYQANPHEAANLTVNMNQFYTTDMKLAILSVTVNTYRQFPQFRVKLLETVVDFCEDESVAVRLQSAFVLRKLSNNPAAVRTTANAYCELLHTIIDENQRAFVVQELIEMIEENRSMMAPFALEMAQGSTVTGNLRNKLLTELVNLVNEENAASLVPLVASKEVVSLEALRILLLRFPSVSSAISEKIGGYVNDTEISVAEPSSLLLKDCGIAGARKEAFSVFSASLEMSGFPSILARAIWSVAEFCEDVDVAADILSDYAKFSENDENGFSKKISGNTITATTVNEDGTYVTTTRVRNDRNLRSMLQEGDAYLALALISALVRLKLRGSTVNNLADIVKSVLSFSGVEKNARDLCQLWLSAVNNESNISSLFQKSSKESFNVRSIKDINGNGNNNSNNNNGGRVSPKTVSAVEPLQFSVLLNVVETVPTTATETVKMPIVQLTGPSDALYVEADCTLRKFDRVYHFYIYNRTESTLTNVFFEFTTVGSVSILQRNDLLSLAPSGSGTFELPVMISSGSSGTLFGAVSFDFAGASGSDHQLLPLSPIEIDPFFCFEPTPLSQSAFREKWSESVWERKIDIQQTFDFNDDSEDSDNKNHDLIAFLKALAKKFKFAIITPMKQLEVTAKNAGFIAANLFTRSFFNEEVEVNVSAKIDQKQKISGFIRIRSPDEQLAFLFGKLIQ